MKSEPPTERSERRRVALSVLLPVGIALALTFLPSHCGHWRPPWRDRQTSKFLHNIASSLEEYRAENGGFPKVAPGLAGAKVMIDGKEWVVGEAVALYQILSGDGTDALAAGTKPSTGEQGSAQEERNPVVGKIYLDNVRAPSELELRDKVMREYVAYDGRHFYVIDAWRHPVRFRVEEPSTENGNRLVIDVWSYGKLEEPDDSAGAREKWITNVIR